MKTTIAKKIYSFIIMMVFSVAFVNAQCFQCPTCSPGKVWGCHWKNDCTKTCKCVNIGSNWINSNPGCAVITRLENQAAGNGQFAAIIYPNPLSNAANISFVVDETQNISLRIFDMNGRLVKVIAEEVFEAGEHQVEWNAKDVESGIYFLRMETGDAVQTEKISVIK